MPDNSELARRTPTGIQVRPGGLRLRWDLTDLAASDGHIARGTFSATARALPQANELKMLEEALLGSRQVLTSADVVAHFADAILVAARKYARGMDAKTLLDDQARQAMAGALMETASGIAFSCGIEILQPAQIDLDCPTLQREQFEEMDRQAAQRRAADQVDQLRRSAELFGQFEAIRASAPELSPGQVLSRIGTSDQADVLKALILASAKRSAPSRLWAVAGNSLVRIEGADSAHAELISIPANLGPLRSVRAGQGGELLLGCRIGVMRLNPDSPADAIEYRDPETTSQLGFNAATVAGNCLWAAHGDAGLVSWPLDQPDKPDRAVRPAASKIHGFSPRNLCRLDFSRVIFSSGGQLAICSMDGEITPLASPAESDIVGVFVQPRRILTTHADGQISSWSSDELKLESRNRRAGRTMTATMLPWMNDARILLATEAGPLLCIGPEDELLTQYASPYPGLRIAAGAADAVAAVTADRQRLLLWYPWDGRKPHSEMFIYGLAKHRIADIAFV